MTFSFKPAVGGSKADAFDTTLGPVAFTPYGSAFARDIWLQSDSLEGVPGKLTLGIHFLDGSESQKEAVRKHGALWLETAVGKRIDFAFDVSREKAHARVTFSLPINWSSIGRNALTSKTNYTMSFDDLMATTVMHEFGHFLGLQHEHRFPTSAIKWNESIVYRDMKAKGWDALTIREQILTKLVRGAACIGDPRFNKSSVMMYPIPLGWASYQDTNGLLRPLIIDTAEKISDGDVACLLGLYK